LRNDVSFGFLSIASRKASHLACDVGVGVRAFTYTRADACRLRRSPSALCQRVLNLTQGALLLRCVSRRSFSVRSRARARARTHARTSTGRHVSQSEQVSLRGLLLARMASRETLWFSSNRTTRFSVRCESNGDRKRRRRDPRVQIRSRRSDLATSLIKIESETPLSRFRVTRDCPRVDRERERRRERERELVRTRSNSSMRRVRTRFGILLSYIFGLSPRAMNRRAAYYYGIL